MGYTGTWVVHAGSEVSPSLEPDMLDSTALVGGGRPWMSAEFEEATFWERDEVLPAVVSATGLPALVGFSLDSDFLGLVGMSPDGSQWSGAVDAESAANHRLEGLEEEYDNILPEFPPAAEALAGARAWAAAAGLPLDEAALRRLLDVTEWEQPADAYWPEVLEAFGLQPRA